MPHWLLPRRLFFWLETATALPYFMRTTYPILATHRYPDTSLHPLPGKALTKIYLLIYLYNDNIFSLSLKKLSQNSLNDFHYWATKWCRTLYTTGVWFHYFSQYAAHFPLDIIYYIIYVWNLPLMLRLIFAWWWYFVTFRRIDRHAVIRAWFLQRMTIFSHRRNKYTGPGLTIKLICTPGYFIEKFVVK